MKHHLLIVATVLLSASTSALAARPVDETSKVVRALVNNPEIVQQLKQNNSPHLEDVQISTVKSGVFQYRLVFTRQCECIPSTATVSILEDWTPTYSDGPIQYASSIEIKTGF